MRLRGQGMKVLGNPHVAGDVLVKIQAKLPETISEELKELITKARGEVK
jgi:DnaJ-class molecular chaperone